MSDTSTLIDDIRMASRQLVRSLGFMGGDFAGQTLPPSAVHALIEIGADPKMTASALGERLNLEKSSVSRMLRKLVLAGDVLEETARHDGRIKTLSLSPAGARRAAAIHAFARAQVASALQCLPPEGQTTVLDGLRLYAGALSGRMRGEPSGRIEIVEGYRPGLIARVTQMHALYYARTAGFGRAFETVVAEGLADFCKRLDRPQNRIWTASRDGAVMGSIAIDGEDLGPGRAHLRWFIVDDGLRGAGAGRQLLSAALAFADAQGFAQTDLWTFSGLKAARHLYETHGFVCIEERPGSQWGAEVLEQRFVRPRPGSATVRPAP